MRGKDLSSIIRPDYLLEKFINYKVAFHAILVQSAQCRNHLTMTSVMWLRDVLEQFQKINCSE